MNFIVSVIKSIGIYFISLNILFCVYGNVCSTSKNIISTWPRLVKNQCDETELDKKIPYIFDIYTQKDSFRSVLEQR